ncbi:hypothetical protein CCS41_08015 [Candidatus Fukatsuia symbiotica]|uniref:Uncharacterized protein n=1 Tax=Candidatus Fukatsuia symbiotica TaxID=1878942 RepID=A0A2U8I8Y1_9GAMM|nr:hypothetical protein CCS41_08015 [Candidatus Fukatsuia symbiotica]
MCGENSAEYLGEVAIISLTGIILKFVIFFNETATFDSSVPPCAVTIFAAFIRVFEILLSIISPHQKNTNFYYDKKFL